MKKLEIWVSDTHYDNLRDAAHARGSTVTQVATSSVVATARTYERPVPRLVAEAHARGLWTGDIAGELGMTNVRVSEVLRALHLVPNPKPLVEKPVSPRSRKPRP